MKPPPKPNIVTVFEHYGLRVLGPDRGGWRKAECPRSDHEDSNPSASVNEDECRWYCHACSEGGDALDVVKEQTGVTRYAELVKLSESFLDGSSSTVRAGTGSSSSLLPHRTGSRPGRGNWQPPWKGL